MSRILSSRKRKVGSRKINSLMNVTRLQMLNLEIGDTKKDEETQR